MRNKQVISDRLDRVESEVRKLNYSIGTNDRDTSYESLDRISSIISDINTLLKRETQQ